MTKSRIGSGLAAAIALSSLALAPAAASAATVKLGATLAGSSEPGSGDGKGKGSFEAEIDPAAGDFCYTLKTEGIGTATAAHVHVGAAGTNGAPVVTVAVADDECIAVEPDVLKPIVANPAGYYVNVHTAAFPAGAIRGQLEKK